MMAEKSGKTVRLGEMTRREYRAAVATTGVPGHATEYETSMALALFPESVRHDAMEDQEDRMSLEATAEKGERLVEITLRKVTEYLRGMIAGHEPA